MRAALENTMSGKFEIASRKFSDTEMHLRSLFQFLQIMGVFSFKMELVMVVDLGCFFQ